MASITLHDDGGITIDDLRTDDPALRELLAASPEEEWPDKIRQALAVGSRGLASMGVGVSVAQVGDAVEQIVQHAAARSERTVAALIDESTRRISSVFDPDDRTSIVARTLGDIEALFAGVLNRLDPSNQESHAGVLLSRLDDAFGDGGALDQRLASSLDPDADGSALATLRSDVDRGMRDLRDLLVKEEGRAEEAERGTVKGFAFEDVVEDRLRSIAGGIGGCVVERTSTCAGSSGAQALVGDAVVTMPDGSRIVVEAKNTARIGLSGTTGILDELDRAMANRDAQFAICISARDAYPAEVGSFGAYGNRILIVDNGSGDMLHVALRWAQVVTAASRVESADIDTAFVQGRLDRIRSVATRFTKSKRALTSIRSTVDDVRNDLDEMRCDLLDLVDEAHREIERSHGPAAVLDESAAIRVA